jgi:hemerythrin-like domain-containing protein
MATDLPGFSGPAPGLEAPLEMLDACHARIRKQCSTLLRLKAHVATSGADEAARAAARSVLRYFDTAARDHHADEEQDLFPAMLESMAGSDPVCIQQLIDRLTSDHRELERLWRSVRTWLVAIEAGQQPASLPTEIGSFVDTYEQHAKLEDEELLPMAKRLLGAEDLDRIGRAMRLRRGIMSF